MFHEILFCKNVWKSNYFLLFIYSPPEYLQLNNNINSSKSFAINVFKTNEFTCCYVILFLLQIQWNIFFNVKDSDKQLKVYFEIWFAWHFFRHITSKSVINLLHYFGSKCHFFDACLTTFVLGVVEFCKSQESLVTQCLKNIKPRTHLKMIFYLCYDRLVGSFYL